MADDGPSTSAPAQVQFKPRKQRALRTTRATSEDPEEAANEAGAVDDGKTHKEKLEEIRLLQKARKKISGASAQLLAAGDQNELAEPQADAHHDSHERTQLMAAFSKATAVAVTEEDPNMEKYVQAELAKRLGKRVDDDAKEDAEAKRRRIEAEMYTVPEELQVNLGQGDVVIPGLNMVITEVAVSAKERMRNIEETEAMKRRMLGGGNEADKQSKGQSLRRNNFVPHFGKQGVHMRDRDRDEAEEEARRMRFMSEKHAALPARKLGKQQGK